MAPRSRLSRSGVTSTAMAVVDRDGYDALSLSIVAEAMGVGPSALYSHIDGLDGLRQVVAAESVRGLTRAVRDAAVGNSGDAALDSAARAYRGFAADHPGRFAAALRAGPDPELDAAEEELHGVFILIHRASGLGEPAAALAARSTRSAIHGFLVIEHSRGAGADHDDEFEHLVRTLCRGLDG